jgi:RNA polymerase sigma-32 factor
MAERNSKSAGSGRGGAGRTGTRAVIDVGDRPTAQDPDRDHRSPTDREDDETEGKGDDAEVDPELIDAAGAAIDADEAVDEPAPVDGDDDAPDGDPEDRDAATVVKTRGSSLARRDPMAAYMSEVRRYPLLTPDEEKALVEAARAVGIAHDFHIHEESFLL